MRIVLGCLIEEVLSVCKVMLLRTCLCCERRLYSFWMSHLQCSIYLICRDMIETLTFKFLWQRLPIELGSLKESQCTHNVCTSECEWIFDTTINMTLSSKMNNTIYMLILHQLIECIKVANVHLDKLIVGFVLNVLKIGKIASISQFVKVDDFILRILVYKKSHHV